MSMTPQAIAANRFGLGMRGDALPPDDAKAYLLQQLTAFDPRPSALADAPGKADIADTLVQFYVQKKAEQMARAASPNGELVNLASNPPPMAAAPTMNATSASTAMTTERPKLARSPEFKQARDDVYALYVGNVGARLNAALVTPTPFVERLVHFWANHFAVSADKPPVTAFAGSLEFDAIRPHVLGYFGDMLRAVEQHPAMLIYLDQPQSIGPNSIVGQRRAANGAKQHGLNENLAREIMELHTLGVRSGYTQADVTEFARAMTGWLVTGLVPGGPDQRPGVPGSPGEAVFHANQHEPGTRAILGRSYAQQDASQSLAVLSDFAAARRSCSVAAT